MQYNCTAHEVGDSASDDCASAHFAGSRLIYNRLPGAHAPGFMPSPASRANFDGFDINR
jgi:hypothetical protein